MEEKGKPSNENGLATTSLVLGVVALFLQFVPFCNLLAFVMAPLAIIFGLISIKSEKKAFAITGIVSGLAVMALLFLSIFLVLSGLYDLEKVFESIQFFL